MIEVPRKDSTSMLDRAISYAFPRWAKDRAVSRMLTTYANSRTQRWESSPRDKTTQQISYEIQDSRDRSRQLDERNGIATGLLNRCVDNVIGSGIRPQAGSSSESWNKKAEELFNDWSSRADVRGLGDLYSYLQPLWFREYLVGGDCGIILLKDGSLQTVDADAISTPIKMSGQSNINDGVEMDNLGKPVRFWVQNGDKTKHKAISAHDFIYYPHIRTVRGTRGEPAFHQTDKYFDQIDGSIEAVVMASQMAAMFGLLIKSEGDIGTLTSLPTTSDARGTSKPAMDLEPAMIKHLMPGESIEQIKPEHPGTNYPEFISLILRLVGLPLGLPLELVLLDFSQTNFSSARASLIQAQRTFKNHQNSFRKTILERIWRWRISKFMKEGLLPNIKDAFSHRWITPGWPYIDPDKEMQANMLAIDAGLSTLSITAAGLGYDYEELLAQRAKEIKIMEKMGIPILHSKKSRDKDPIQQAQQPIGNPAEKKKNA